MKGDTQLKRLEEMMLRQDLLRDYMLGLPRVQIKHAALKRLKEGDVILLHQNRLRLQVYDNGIAVAEGLPVRCASKLMLPISLKKPSAQQRAKGKKKAMLICALGSIRSKRLSAEESLDISDIDLSDAILVHDRKEIARGILVNVNNEIAVKITKVY